MVDRGIKMIDFNAKAKEIFEQNKAVGWWDDMNRCIYQTLQLINTEIAEATEGARKNLMDDHLTHRKMEEVELADVLIRTLDLGGRCGWRYMMNDSVIDEAADAISESGYTVGRHHLGFTVIVSSLANEIDEDSLYDSDDAGWYSMLILSVCAYAKFKGYDIIGAMEEKLAYNLERQDHKRENRKGEAGQKAF